ncbi:hypothetical protein ENSA5_28100 [Enhygromyxa salina]|uniref:Uncharacterized protein n=2 Tax=Enhygromyxa salina TaxID=215803 RepID=A0A2S9Y4J6_9BACT|nr:hypothetical protein ENSA5_28100 [Enhygromyxa salina]
MYGRLFIFSLVTYVLAFVLTTIAHEFGHGILSAVLGGDPIVHHVYVEHHGLEGGPRAAASAAGPLVSLLQGAALWLVLARSTRGPSVARLLVLWLCLHGLINFFGYLITTPFVPNADIGKIATWLELPALARWALCAIGLGGITWIGYWSRAPLLSFVVEAETDLDLAARTRHVYLTGVGPWLLGWLVIALASWPAPHWITYAYPFFAGFFLITTVKAIGGAPVEGAAPAWVKAPLWPWLLLLAAVLVIFATVLRPGVALAG